MIWHGNTHLPAYVFAAIVIIADPVIVVCNKNPSLPNIVLARQFGRDKLMMKSLMSNTNS